MTIYEQHQYSPVTQRVIERARETSESSYERSALTSKIAERPWASFGVALLAGYALGSLGGSSEHDRDAGQMRDYSSSRPADANQRTSQYNAGLREYGSASYAPESSSKTEGEGVTTYRGGAAPTAAPTPSARPDATPHAHDDKPGMVEQLTSQFGGELDTLKRTAVTTVIGLLRDTVQQNLPAVHREMERLRAERGGTSFSSAPGAAGDDTPSGPVFGASSASHNTAMR